MEPSPYYLKKDHTIQDIEHLAEIKDKKYFQRQDIHYLCKFCKARITSWKFKIKVHGEFKHICVNPNGIVFEVGCFSEASNCIPIDNPTKEFTWFPGYAWQVILCSTCLNHLGWLYTSNNSYFVGLILTNLIEEQEDN